ncbi:MAG: hypothetical protein IKM91_07695, partial [Candidatus Methanomethylophilaceae archaeon]|nr:hypothetical protein [Candidatus Methanomethylophilaceae archaeon]
LVSDLSTQDGRDTVSTALSKESPEVIFLINCAGLGRFGDSFSIDPAETRSMIEVNVTSVVEPHSCIDLITRDSLDVYPEGFEEFPLGFGDLVESPFPADA